MSSPIRIAFLLRFRDDLINADTPTIEAHNTLFRKKGKVWFGKFGAPIDQSALHLCAIPSVETFLILSRSKAPKHAPSPTIFIATVSAAQNRRPTLSLIPAYYRDNPNFSTWFCITSELRPLTATEANAWVIASSGQNLPLAIRHCPRTYIFFVRKTDRTRFKPLYAQRLLTYKESKPQPRKRITQSEDEGFNAEPPSSLAEVEF